LANPHVLIQKLTLFAIILALVVVSLGAYTRIKEAGLACPDWPGCYGNLGVPSSERQLSEAALLFPNVPVEAGKAWTEMVHRYMAAALGLLIFVIAFFVWRHHLPYRKYVSMLALLVVFQALLGMWTVTLKLHPAVVVSHLFGGFVILVLLVVLHVRCYLIERIPAPVVLKRLAVIAFFVLVVQIFLGGWTSANYAALACPELPLCQGALIPPQADFVEAFNVMNFSADSYQSGVLSHDARVAIHWSHRLGALVTLLVIISLAWRLISSGVLALQHYGYVLGLLVVSQFALGLGNVWLHLPLYLAVLHNGDLFVSVVGSLLYP